MLLIFDLSNPSYNLPKSLWFPRLACWKHLHELFESLIHFG